jgi:hypothetical protein
LFSKPNLGKEIDYLVTVGSKSLSEQIFMIFSMLKLPLKDKKIIAVFQ